MRLREKCESLAYKIEAICDRVVRSISNQRSQNHCSSINHWIMWLACTGYQIQSQTLRSCHDLAIKTFRIQEQGVKGLPTRLFSDVLVNKVGVVFLHGYPIREALASRLHGEGRLGVTKGVPGEHRKFTMYSAACALYTQRSRRELAERCGLDTECFENFWASECTYIPLAIDGTDGRAPQVSVHPG